MLTLNVVGFQKQGVLVENDSAFVVEELVENVSDSNLEGLKKEHVKEDLLLLAEAFVRDCFSKLDIGRVKHQRRSKDCISDGGFQEKINRGKGKSVLKSFTRVPLKPSRLDL